ncbi:hypothetical protein [Kitasatospora griseola]|uniref:hypothetical protein n=1 Tax=Kitasatospora griseola TaxID=2064 RepID=UPI00380B870D
MVGRSPAWAQLTDTLENNPVRPAKPSFYFDRGPVHGEHQVGVVGVRVAGGVVGSGAPVEAGGRRTVRVLVEDPAAGAAASGFERGDDLGDAVVVGQVPAGGGHGHGALLGMRPDRCRAC